MRDFSKRFTSSVTVNAATYAANATTNGTGVDTTNSDGASLKVTVGAYTDAVINVYLQESSDNSAFTNVANTDVAGGTNPALINASNNATVVVRSYLGVKRYLRGAVIITGATTGAVLGVNIEKYLIRKMT